MDKTNYNEYNKFIKKIKILLEYNTSFNYSELNKKLIKTGRLYNSIINRKPSNNEELIIIIKKLEELGRGVKLETLCYVYGLEEGTRKFDEYREKQAYTNSLEYKKTKYGYNQEDFNIFNKSRAVTLKNLTKKYGLEEGTRKFDEYREKQAYTNSKDYLKERYEEVNKRKGHSLENYIFRLGKELGLEEYNKYQINMSKNTSSYSKISQELFFKLIATDLFRDKNVYFAEFNYEYGLYSHDNKKYYRYDFVCPELKICIEFHGDHYHGNPKLYKPNDMLRGRGCNKKAKDKWLEDNIKINEIKILRDIETIIIWESDYRNSELEVIERIIRNVTNRI